MCLDQLSEEQIFEQAFQLQSDDARREYLLEVCRDEEQIERVEALLKAGAPEASFLENGPAVLQESNNGPPDLPERIGDFEILGELGRGGMGVVYRARQCSLNRLVALKVLSTGLALTTKAIMRFKLEAEAAAKLHHTNIVPIYWTGEENRVPYYAMELIDGPSLDQVIKQLRAEDSGETNDAKDSRDQHVPDWIKETLIYSSPSATKTATETDASSFDSSSSLGTDSSYYDNLAKMMAGVADALAHAHDHGIVHRDIKPANLLLSADGRLSVNDFGLARMLEQPGMTMTGEFMGSPMYMSPEQITAGRLPLDHRTDIYSLGATLYELLTLTPPFPGNQRDQVLTQVMHKDPPKPRSINPRIPRDLETICLKAMEKDPDRRYQTAEQMAEDLRRFVNRHAITARRDSLLEKGVRWVRKNKAISAMACVTLLIVAVAGSYAYWIRLENKQVQAERQAEDAIRIRRTAMNNALMAARRGDLDAAMSELSKAKDLGVETWWTNMLRGQVYLAQGKRIEALDEFKQAEKANPDSVIVQCLMAEGFLVNGRWEDYMTKVKAIVSHPLHPENRTPEELLFLSTAYRFVDDQQALDLLDLAIEADSTFQLARIVRASVKTHKALNETDRAVAEQALKELNAFETLDSNIGNDPLFRNARLENRLALASLCRFEGNQPQAEKVLEDAQGDVAFLAELPKYQPGRNYNRLHYYGIRWDLYKQERDLAALGDVMQEAVEAGSRGWIIDYYWTVYFRTGDPERIRQALDQLEAMPQRDEYVAWASLVLLMELNEQDRADVVFDEIEENSPRDSAMAHLFRRGGFETEEAKEVARRTNEQAKPFTEHQRITRDFAMGRMEEEDFESSIEAIDRERQRIEAYWALGLKQLAEGRRDAAKESFGKIKDSPYYAWSPRLYAHAFYDRLEKNDGWPEWLPAASDDEGRLEEEPD